MSRTGRSDRERLCLSRPRRRPNLPSCLAPALPVHNTRRRSRRQLPWGRRVSRDPDAATSYRVMISAWLEGHKRYPESARQRGEEGSAPLRFRIDRSRPRRRLQLHEYRIPRS